MEYDPLTQPTRRARRALIAVSGISILTTVFCARIESLPVGGVSLSFDAGFLPITLGVALIYLFFQFLIYIQADWINRGRTPAEIAESEAREAVLREVERAIREKASSEVRRNLGRDADPFSHSIEAVVGVFRMYQNRAIDDEELVSLLQTTGMHANSISILAHEFRQRWAEVDEKTTKYAERAKISLAFEKMRFRVIEKRLPLVLIFLAAVLLVVDLAGYRSVLGLGSCGSC